MKKIYFAGKFKLAKNKEISLAKRLIDDYRAILLEDSKKLTFADKNLKLNGKYLYKGSFYCEQASNGDFTSTDCNIVLNSEYQAVNDCDIFFAVFDDNFSVGTIVELGWAINFNKQIIIFYKEEESSYQIKSDYWFAIADALKRSNRIKVKRFNNIKEVINEIKKESVFDEI